MSLKPLIKKQKLIIDDHKWGAGEKKEWEKGSTDVHLDKETKYKIEGKTHKVRIRIPINSDRDIKVEYAKQTTRTVPKRLNKEIKEAFFEPEIRNRFIVDLIKILANYQSTIDSLEKAREALANISRHFGLKWTNDEVIDRVGSAVKKLTRIYSDEGEDSYYISIDRSRIEITDIEKWDLRTLLKNQ